MPRYLSFKSTDSRWLAVVSLGEHILRLVHSIDGQMQPQDAQVEPQPVRGEPPRTTGQRPMIPGIVRELARRD